MITETYQRLSCAGGGGGGRGRGRGRGGGAGYQLSEHNRVNGTVFETRNSPTHPKFIFDVFSTPLSFIDPLLVRTLPCPQSIAVFYKLLQVKRRGGTYPPQVTKCCCVPTVGTICLVICYVLIIISHFNLCLLLLSVILTSCKTMFCLCIN